jgi:hypothetical protein
LYERQAEILQNLKNRQAMQVKKYVGESSFFGQDIQQTTKGRDKQSLYYRNHLAMVEEHTILLAFEYDDLL